MRRLPRLSSVPMRWKSGRHAGSRALVASGSQREPTSRTFASTTQCGVARSSSWPLADPGGPLPSTPSVARWAQKGARGEGILPLVDQNREPYLSAFLRLRITKVTLAFFFLSSCSDRETPAITIDTDNHSSNVGALIYVAEPIDASIPVGRWGWSRAVQALLFKSGSFSSRVLIKSAVHRPPFPLRSFVMSLQG